MSYRSNGRLRCSLLGDLAFRCRALGMYSAAFPNRLSPSGGSLIVPSTYFFPVIALWAIYYTKFLKLSRCFLDLLYQSIWGNLCVFYTLNLHCRFSRLHKVSNLLTDYSQLFIRIFSFSHLTWCTVCMWFTEVSDTPPPDFHR